MPKIYEQDIQKSILDYLHMIGCYAIKVQSGGALNAYTNTYISLAPAGTPDIICSLPPVEYDPGKKIHPLGFIECKTQNGRLALTQISMLRKLHKAGMLWLVARSIDDVIRWHKDWKFHGEGRDIEDILDDSRKFVPTAMKSKKSKLGTDALLEFEMWSRRGDKPS